MPNSSQGPSVKDQVPVPGYDNFSHKNVKVTKFGHMTTSTFLFESRNKGLFVTSWAEIMTP